MEGEREKKMEKVEIDFFPAKSLDLCRFRTRTNGYLASLQRKGQFISLPLPFVPQNQGQ